MCRWLRLGNNKSRPRNESRLQFCIRCCQRSPSCPPSPSEHRGGRFFVCATTNLFKLKTEPASGGGPGLQALQRVPPHFISLLFGIHRILRTPARRARMASRLAFLAPNFRTENHFRRTTYGFGLQVAFQYVRGRLDRRSTSFCTPTMPDELLRRRISAHQRRNICLGGPNFASNFR